MRAGHGAGPGRGSPGLDRPSSVRHSARVSESGREWKRLSSYVVDARVAAGYLTRRAFADALGDVVEYRTLSNLERGTRVGDNTLAIVERFLKWAPGSAKAVLYGGEPVPVAHLDVVKPTSSPDEEFRSNLRAMRRGMGREAFLRWVDEASQEGEEGSG